MTDIRSPLLTPEQVAANASLSWDYCYFVDNWPEEDLQKLIELLPKDPKVYGNNVSIYRLLPIIPEDDDVYSWFMLSSNTRITMEMVYKHNGPTTWFWDQLVTNPVIYNDIMWEDVLAHSLSYRSPRDFVALSLTNRLNPQHVIDNPGLPWRAELLSGNPKITWGLVQAFPNWNWDWSKLSINPAISWETISRNLTRRTYYFFNSTVPWDWYLVSQRKDVTLNMIISTPEYPWDWSGVGLNPNVTLELVLTHHDRNWDWGALVRNHNVRRALLAKIERQ
jgi:hypothetical protein